MHKKLIFVLILTIIQSTLTHDHENNSCDIQKEYQQIFYNNNLLKVLIDQFFGKNQKLKDLPEFTSLIKNIDINTLFDIAENYVVVFGSMSPNEFNAFLIMMHEYVKSQQENNNDLQLFKNAIEFIQKNILTWYTVDELLVFGILCELFEDYIQINRELCKVSNRINS